MEKLFVAGLAVVASATSAMATPILDFTGVSTTITGELAPAVSAGLPIAAIILGATIGYKLFRRFVK